jgi:hypothetical protein
MDDDKSKPAAAGPVQGAVRPGDASECPACCGKGWNDVWKKVDGHHDGREMFRVDCDECGGYGEVGDAEADAECTAPPLGWRCTRGDGHEGPCAAVACPEDVAFVERGMQRLREAGYFGSTEAPKDGA